MSNHLDNLILNGLHGGIRSVNKQFYVSGNIFQGDRLLTEHELFDLFCEAFAHNTISELLSTLNGFYFIVCVNKHFLFAAVDKLRSRPLFYLSNAERFYLSDSVNSLLDFVAVPACNSLAIVELQRAGYVTGSDTLSADIKQIQAGEYIKIDSKKKSFITYNDFLPKNSDSIIDSSVLENQLDKAMANSINRLIKLAAGRQIVIPLSGGYDSRAIAIYLKASGYHNVIAFTFGSKASQEVKISQAVAEFIGIEWHLVTYSWKSWRDLKQTRKFSDYLEFISGFVSTPNVQAYPAIKNLVERGVVNSDAIVVPGHAGDFVAGSHIPDSLIGLPAKDNQEPIIEAILKRHFFVDSKLGMQKELSDKLRSQVTRMIEAAVDNVPATTIFETWDFQERQTKFICNSNRYYDAFKLDWWMPFWDKEVVDFWENAPFVKRVGSKFWQQFVLKKCSDLDSAFPLFENADDQYGWLILRLRLRLDYFTDSNRLYALVPFHRWLMSKLRIPFANGFLFAYLSEKVIDMQLKKILKTK